MNRGPRDDHLSYTPPLLRTQRWKASCARDYFQAFVRLARIELAYPSSPCRLHGTPNPRRHSTAPAGSFRRPLRAGEHPRAAGGGLLAGGPGRRAARLHQAERLGDRRRIRGRGGGRKTGREHFNEAAPLAQEAAGGSAVVITEKTDRMYRNLRDYVVLDELGVELHLVKEGVVISEHSKSAEKFMHGIKVLMAKNYSDNLSEEVKKGLYQKASEGRTRDHHAELWQCAQDRLDGKPMTRPGARQFAFGGVLTCGLCGSAVTPEHHKGHAYYRCFRRCQGQGYVREERLATMLAEQLRPLKMSEAHARLVAEKLKVSPRDRR
ncbi:MAG: recombinase family protein [Deltaproteobacteria bacterium]|nr:recombinase family protein [Deltaproteobacteria bacterium]